MTIQLTQSRVVNGSVATSGTQFTLAEAVEADFIANGWATRVGAAPSQGGAVNPAFLTTTSSGGVSMSALGKKIKFGTHVRAVVIGDSLTVRNKAPNPIVNTNSAMGAWNWANWLIGAPFHFVKNLGVSGDLSRSILSRIEHIPSNVQVVFLWTGTNDVLAVSAVASQATVDAAYTTITGYIHNGMAALAEAGKIVVIGTIPPNDNYTAGDSRIDLLDRVNAYILSLASSTVFVADIFTALWDSAQPTARVFKSGTLDTYNTGKTHPNNNGAMLAGKASMTAAKAAYACAIPDVDLYDGWELCRLLYSNFRSNTNGDAAVKSNGTGTLADGWRTRNAAGTATFTLDNSTAYTPSADFVGPFVDAPSGIDSRKQNITVTSASASDLIELMPPSNSTVFTQATTFPDNIIGGDEFFMEIDAEVINPTALTNLYVTLQEYHTAGTSPADQPYAGTTYTSVKGCSADDFSVTPAAYSEGFRVVIRTPILKVPENVNTTSGNALGITVDALFNGADTTTVLNFGRPKIWHRNR